MCDDDTAAGGPAARARRPLIGISSYLDEAAWGVWKQPAALIATTYVAAVTEAGGIAVVLPPQAEGAAEVVSRLDGLVLSGGPDVDPDRYARRGRDPRTGPANHARDAWESALFEAALAADLPVLGVCRGMQLMNVVLGGELHQHLPDEIASDAHQPARAVFGEESVRVDPASRTGGILGARTPTRCYHHQAVDRLGTGLTAVAWHDDQTVEAVELPGKRFVLGVQWHPETQSGDRRLFRALVRAAQDARETAAPADNASRKNTKTA